MPSKVDEDASSFFTAHPGENSDRRAAQCRFMFGDHPLGGDTKQKAERAPHDGLSAQRRDPELPQHRRREAFRHLVDSGQHKRDRAYDHDVNAGGDQRRISVAEA